MANELTVSARLRLIKDGVDMSLPRELGDAAFNVTVTGTEYNQNIQVVGTTHELLDGGDATPGGYTIFVNRDATNYVELGLDVTGTFAPFVRLKAGERAVFRFTAGASLYLRANTAPCRVEFLVLED